jgi:hypothetical protein
VTKSEAINFLCGEDEVAREWITLHLNLIHLRKIYDDLYFNSNEGTDFC